MSDSSTSTSSTCKSGSVGTTWPACPPSTPASAADANAFVQSDAWCQGLSISMQPLTRADVRRRLQLVECASDDDIEGIYLQGSRLWGTATYNSDFDLLIVTRAGCYGGDKKHSKHHGDVDATVMDATHFVRRLQDHSFLEVIAFYEPAEFVWFESDAQRKRRLAFTLDCRTLQRQVLAICDRDWNVARKFALKNTVENRVAKTLIHGLRMIVISIQLCKYGRVTDFTQACKTGAMITEKAHLLLSSDDVEATMRDTFGALFTKARAALATAVSTWKTTVGKTKQ